MGEVHRITFQLVFSLRDQRESGRARVTVSGEIAQETETDYNITHTHAATKKVNRQKPGCELFL